MAKVKLPGETKLKDPKHELFCILYAGVASGYYFGNATRCYLHAYGKEKEIEELEKKIETTHHKGKQGDNERREHKGRIKSIERAAQSASARLLSSAIVSNRANYLLDRYLSDDYADREMAFVISQRVDLMAKVAAYREVAKVKERVRGAGAISGEFSFEWEGDEPKKGEKAKAPTVKKATVKLTTAGPDEEMEAGFLE